MGGSVRSPRRYGNDHDGHIYSKFWGEKIESSDKISNLKKKFLNFCSIFFVAHFPPFSASPFLPPRVPIRNSPMTSSLRSRPPPPPYNRSPAHKIEQNSSFFEPIAHSTPNSSILEERRVVGEGEKRELVRDKVR